MTAGKVAAIFDVGKTNKKLLLFNQEYQLVKETSVQLPETTDEDGFACEDVHALTNWVITNFEELSMSTEYQLAALNFSSYGASFVHLDKSGEPCCPLYNYLKLYPDNLKNAFYNRYGGEEDFSMLTASPVLGSLNSGMQLYRLKHEQPDLFAKIRTSLHLPQYLNYILSGKTCTDITSVGCHTNLWNFRSNSYHQWVNLEKIDDKFAPVVLGDALVNDPGTSRQPPIGIGLHDSSAALIPYLQHFRDPFILISTGTWCISMNPFNKDPLTKEELRNDCLCYLTYKGEPVKSSRLFAGNEHEKQIKRLGDFFHKNDQAVSQIRFNKEIYDSLVRQSLPGQSSVGQPSVGQSSVEHSSIGQSSVGQPASKDKGSPSLITGGSAFSNREIAEFPDYETAYHQLMIDIMVQQVASTRLVMNATGVKQIFVDGGFSKNEIYMNLLSMSFPEITVSAATVPQSTGLGAALAIHKHWNKNLIPQNLIQLKTYHSKSDLL
ncbi:FGGY-family carbohydrate kinase [Flavitalea sp.]|nr:FGGY family carbohydrate kinase [Flavitalea sp.]